jgi:hypothetical protein
MDLLLSEMKDLLNNTINNYNKPSDKLDLE